jgi:dipeptidyl aminopeptidase/acylaminoacyl peptidase
MRSRMRLLALGVLAVLIVAIVVIGYRIVSGVGDPESASCRQPPISVAPPRIATDHREVDVRYTCEDASQAATVYLPTGLGRHPGLVWVHGAGPARRLSWGGSLLPGLVGAGIAVLSYDKRGAGHSEGECCPGDSGHFNLLTADVVGAINVLRARPDIDPDEVGLAGASQAGWIAPRAANQAHAAFVALASAPAVPERVANLYERLSAGEDGQLSRAEISRRLREAGRQGFDSLPDLRRMTMPSLWLFGTADVRTPVPESVAVLQALQREGHDIAIRTYPGAGHGLVDNPPTAPDAIPAMIEWIRHRTQVGTRTT